MFDEFNRKVNMGNKKKDIDVKSLVAQNEIER
jgi:hypothetical protein